MNVSAAADRPARVHLDAVDARLVGVAGCRQAVLAEERELEVVPVLREHRAVEAQPVAAPRRLPADLVVREEVRQVRRHGADAVDAARPEASDQVAYTICSSSNLYGSVELADRVLLVDALVEVLARRRAGLVDERHPARRIEAIVARTQVAAQRLAVPAAAAEAVGEAEEAFQRVLRLEVAHAAGHASARR